MERALRAYQRHPLVRETPVSTGGRELLDGPGKIAHEKAIKKARAEYRKYESYNPSPVEKAYFEELKRVAKIAKKKSK